MNALLHQPWLEYQRADGANPSLILQPTAAHMRQYLVDLKLQVDGIKPITVRPHYTLGTIVHRLVFEPESAMNGLVVMPEKIGDANWRSKERQEWYSEVLGMEEPPAPPIAIDVFRDYAARQGISIITEDDRRDILGMANSVLTLRDARTYLEHGESEVSVFAERQIEELELSAQTKGRIDHLPWGNVIADLKTTQSADRDDFARSVADWRYMSRMAFYMDSVNELIERGVHKGPPKEVAVLIAVEKKPPYLAAVYPIAQRAIEFGRADYRRKLAIYQMCQQTGVWPGYEQGQVLDLPNWVYRNGK